MRRLVLALGLFLSSCATGPDVRTDYDHSADFSKSRLYSWGDSTAPRGMNPLLFQRVKRLIDSSLAAKGFAQSPVSNFTVSFTITNQKQTEFYDQGPNYGWSQIGTYPVAGDTIRYRPFDDELYVDQFLERRFIIDIYDSALNQPVWHGVVVDDSAGDEDQVDYGRVAIAIDAVLAKFPPSTGMNRPA